MSEVTSSIEQIIGDTGQLDAEMRRFSRDATALSGAGPGLMRKYAKKWVAMREGRVLAAAPSLNSVLGQIDAMGLRREDVAVHYLDRTQRRMVL